MIHEFGPEGLPNEPNKNELDEAMRKQFYNYFGYQAPEIKKPITLTKSRPNRNIIIQKDEITDLKIKLESCKSIEEFLKMM